MELFIYDELTLEYIGVEQQHIDPLESIAAGKDVYITATNGTKEVPLEPVDGFTPLFLNGSWVLIELPEALEEGSVPDFTDEQLEEQAFQEWVDKTLRAQYAASKK